MSESNNDYSIMEKVEAARNFTNRVHGVTRETELEAFMSIFHPEFYKDKEKMRDLKQNMRDPKGRVGT